MNHRHPVPLPRFLLRTVFCLCLTLQVALIRANETSVPQPGSIVVEEASVRLPDGSTLAYELGTLHVRENRDNPASRIIGVGFARFRALAPTGAPPTFHLPGGPGGSYLRGMNLTKADPAARKLNARQAQDLALYRAVGDVVYVDQRGATDRGEILAYHYRTKAQPLDQPGSLARATADRVETARAAVAEARARGVDLAGYTAAACADDVEELRRALGYDRITLVGQSFGSQWSFALMRRHPASVARAVLSGTEPLDLAYDMPSHVYEAMRRQWLAVERDPRFAPYLPPGGIAGAVRDIIRRLEQAPLRVTVEDGSGGKTTVTLGREDFQPGSPASILEIYHGRYDRWAQGEIRQRRSRDGRLELLGYLIDTGLAVSPERRALLRSDPAIAVLGEWNFDDYMATEDIWPTPDAGDDFRREIQCDIPVLFVHGDWDTSTPVENLVQVLPFFTRSRAIVVHQGQHGAYARMRETRPDATAAVMDFIRTGNTANLPSRVTVPLPDWAAPDFPAPSGKNPKE